MLTDPLPTTLDLRKAAARGAGVGGALKARDLVRFRPLLAGDEGEISVEMECSRDEDGRYLVRVAIEADVLVTCQRCLETMPEHLSSDNTLVVVWTDAEAASLPKHLDPLVATEPTSNLWELVEDELILGMRPFSYHDTEQCNRKSAAFSDPEPEDEGEEGKPNPFSVLDQLKPVEKKQEL
jgi:uncharacterized protein